MSFFGRLFGSRGKAADKVNSFANVDTIRNLNGGSLISTASGTIEYDPELIGKLKSDHVNLISIFNDINAAYNVSDARRLVDSIDKFRFALQNHLVVENVKFYSYVQQIVINDQDSTDYAIMMRRDMGKIAQSVLRFLNKYSSDPALAFRNNEFRTELDAIGNALVRRIEAEEQQLYMLYMK